MGLSATKIALGEAGYFQVLAGMPGQPMRDVTFFRGVPTQINALSTQDPFGDAQLTLQFPQITMFDRPGTGDLDWLIPGANYTVRWVNTSEVDYGIVTGYDESGNAKLQTWMWQGFSVDETWSITDTDTSLTVECKGQLYQLDNYLAKPFFPSRPWPYELLLKRAMDPRLHPGLRTKGLLIEWPADWDTRVPVFSAEDYLSFLRPYGVSEGDLWTSLTARSTGAWDQTLTGFIQGMLSVMYDEGGSQWTIRMDEGRQPVLYLRRPPSVEDPGVLMVNLGTPGITASFSRDFSQSANVIYGVGSDLAGASFSGMVVSSDGERTTYEPFAASRAVYPDVTNPSYDRMLMRRETRLQFPTGMDERACRQLSAAQLQRFADPGYTGSITLKTDVFTARDRVTFPRVLIRAGQSILVRGIRGDTFGTMFHITESAVNFAEGTTTLTLDSKYRDQLTVDEVRARTRDALTPLRMLQTGKQSVTVNDLMKPWSYAEGSGMLPRAAKEFFNYRIPDDAQFPWEDWTKKYPPKNPDCAKFYVRIPPARISAGEARYNWSGQERDPMTGLPTAPIAIYMAQSANIRLTQIAAYDRDGNVLKVRFHVGVYYNSGTTWQAMPRVPALIGGSPAPIRQPDGGTFGLNDYTPFFRGAFEKIQQDGSEYANEFYMPSGAVDMPIGWGTYWEPAGYSPGTFQKGAPKTGMLVDETSWTFSGEKDPSWNPTDRQDNLDNKYAGMAYIMIYCDDHPTDQPVYFLGRFFRSDPGTSS